MSDGMLNVPWGVIERLQGDLAALDPGTEDILIVYGDMLFDIALPPLREFHRRKNALLTILAHPNDHPRSSDLIVERDGVVREVLPHRRLRRHDHRNLVPAGLYLASPAFFAGLEPGAKADMIDDVLPRLIAAGASIAVYNTPEYLRDVGSPARHALAERDLFGGEDYWIRVRRYLRTAERSVRKCPRKEYEKISKGSLSS